jgi:hypothetical protein
VTSSSWKIAADGTFYIDAFDPVVFAAMKKIDDLGFLEA